MKTVRPKDGLNMTLSSNQSSMIDRRRGLNGYDEFGKRSQNKSQTSSKKSRSHR